MSDEQKPINNKFEEIQDYISKKIQIIISAPIFMFILIILGIICYISAQGNLNIPVTVSEAHIKESQNSRAFYEILKLLAGTCISTGFLSLILRLTSMKKDTIETVLNTYKGFSQSILSANFDLDHYSDITLETLNKKIVLKLADVPQEDIDKMDDSSYCLEKQLRKLLSDIYYEYHEMTTVLIPNEQSKTIKKQVTLEYKVINSYEKDNKIKFMIKLIEGTSKDKSMFNVKKFQINNRVYKREEIDEFKAIEIIDEPNSNITHAIVFHKPLDKCKEHTIILRYEYEVPIDDLIHSFKLPCPCKKFNHSIMISGEESSNWELHVNGFTSWFYRNSHLKEFRITNPTKTNAEVKFNHWTLPGAGYVVVLKQKK